ncbi:MAG TPA: lysophospholipid acyltransferase family protein [Gaiellaceae bacterium]|nr:lysophospholipid acyltransferase family protein [Gaiellaceae bacterium]
MPSPLYNTIAVLSLPIVSGLYRLEVEGRDRLPPRGGFVLAANHTSNFDPWPLGLPLWPQRQLFFMAKVELFNPVLAPILRGAGAFPIRRGQGDIESIETAARICREGGIVAMFPEGTRREKGLRKKFEPRPRTGSARIALAAQVPLVPAAIKGSDRLSRLAKLRIAYGEPVPVEDLEGLTPREAHHQATARLMERIDALYAAL